MFCHHRLTNKQAQALDSTQKGMAMDIPPMEDVVSALMQHLVAPWLPSLSFIGETYVPPSLSEQETVAKQVHALVVLYNYYHKKQEPNAEILQFNLFCQLAVIIKRPLLGHLKIMHYDDISEIDDVENHLSLTEKAVMSALDISAALDPCKNFPSIENWKVSGVAVLLVNSTQEKCFLQYGSVIKGVWSLIERDIQVQAAKNERIKRKLRENESQVDEAALLPLVLSAVEEDTGINANNVVLESHTVYSLTREKRAVQFYIVQSVQSIDKDLYPIKDVIERLQGPLFRTRDDSWEATAVVEYFHLLPYAEVIKAWFSRSLNSKPGFEAKEHNQDVDDSLVQKNDSGTKVGLQYVDDHYSMVDCQTNQQTMDVDNPSMVDCQANQKTMDVDNSLVQKEMVGQADEVNKKQIIKSSGLIGRVMGDQAIVSHQSNTECQNTLQVSQVPKKLLQTLLKVLFRKKMKLAHQLRDLEGEIAMCEKNIQTIMDGKIEGEDEVEAILNFIDVSYKGEAEAQVGVSQQSGIQVQPILERKKLSDAVIPFLNPCQQLDVICDTNCWSLPTYKVYPVEGGYRASIKLEGADFEYCEEGSLCAMKSLARESVAGKMIAKFQSVAGKSH